MTPTVPTVPALSAGLDLTGVSGVLVPHDGGPVADLLDRPDRWALLDTLTQALRRDVPVLAWGSGAALAGRALGAGAYAGGADPERAPAEWSQAPRGAAVHAWAGAAPLHWTHGRVTAWAGTTLPPELHAAFVAALPGLRSRRPATPLEAVGGRATLRPLLADFYTRVRADALLGPVFAAHVGDWDAHLDRVTDFWATVLGERAGRGPRWRGDLHAAHAGLGVRRAHLDRWLTLFSDAAHAHLPPGEAQALRRRAAVMGGRLGSEHARRNFPGAGRVAEGT